MHAQLTTPTTIFFTNDTSFTLVVKVLDENNNWVELLNEPVGASYTYAIPYDGIYCITATDGTSSTVYGHLSYEELKLKLRTYIKEELCNCCDKGCSPCDNRTMYHFNMLVHLSLAYLGKNDYIVSTPFDPNNEIVIANIQAINNALQRSKKYILKYGL